MQCDTLFILALLLHRIFFVYDVFLSRRLGCPTLEDVKAWEVNRPVYYDLTDGLRELTDGQLIPDRRPYPASQTTYYTPTDDVAQPYRRRSTTQPTANNNLTNDLDYNNLLTGLLQHHPIQSH